MALSGSHNLIGAKLICQPFDTQQSLTFWVFTQTMRTRLLLWITWDCEILPACGWQLSLSWGVATLEAYFRTVLLYQTVYFDAFLMGKTEQPLASVFGFLTSYTLTNTFRLEKKAGKCFPYCQALIPVTLMFARWIIIICWLVPDWIFIYSTHSSDVKWACLMQLCGVKIYIVWSI